MHKGIKTPKSIYKNWLSEILVPLIYNNETVKNWISEYNSINLKDWNVVVNAALPSFSNVITHDIS